MHDLNLITLEVSEELSEYLIAYGFRGMRKIYTFVLGEKKTDVPRLRYNRELSEEMQVVLGFFQAV